MKNVANCDKYCELRNSWIIKSLNANGAYACIGTSIWVLVLNLQFLPMKCWDFECPSPLCDGHFKWMIINKILQWHLVVLGINLDIQTLLFYHQPQIRWEYPLNLSILISGGKETNWDSLSSGEWSGKSSNLKSPLFRWRIVVYEIIFVGVIMVKISWNEVSKKVKILFEAINYINICL